MTVKVNRVVFLPFLPSFLVTSLMLMRGSSSRMVPIALAVGDGRVRRAAEVDDEGLGRLGEAVAVDRDRERPAGLAGRDGHVPGRGRVVAAGRGGDVRRVVVDRHVDVGGGREGQREGGVGRAGVALGDGHVADLIAGGSSGDQSPSLSSTETVFDTPVRDRHVGAAVAVEVGRRRDRECGQDPQRAVAIGGSVDVPSPLRRQCVTESPDAAVPPSRA